MVLKTLQKTWMSGTTLCISIPKDVKAVLNIEAGDFLQMSWDEVIKRDDIKGEQRIPRRGPHKGEIVVDGEVVGNVAEKKSENLPEL